MLYSFVIVLVLSAAYLTNGEEAAAATTASPSKSPSGSPSPAPTSPSVAPTESPSPSPTAPSSAPTPSPSAPTEAPTPFIDNYLMDMTVTQRCCNSTLIPDDKNICQEADNKSACDTSFFIGNVLDLVAPSEPAKTADSCSCQYTFKYLDFDIDMPSSEPVEGVVPFAPRIEINQNKWIDVASYQLAWDVNVTSKYQTKCHKLYVTQCNEDDECAASLIPSQITGNTTQKLIDQTQSKSDWINYAEDNTMTTQSTCFCYWLFDQCPEEPEEPQEPAEADESESPEQTEDDGEEEEEEDETNMASPFSIKMAITIICISFISVIIF